MKGTCYNCGSGTSQLEWTETPNGRQKICKKCRVGESDL